VAVASIFVLGPADTQLLADHGRRQWGPHVASATRPARHACPGERRVRPSHAQPARGLASVTVVGPDLGTADAYATAAFALGRDASELLAQFDGYGAFVVTEAGTTEVIGLSTAA
jgi:hypothetical protein